MRASPAPSEAGAPLLGHARRIRREGGEQVADDGVGLRAHRHDARCRYIRPHRKRMMSASAVAISPRERDDRGVGPADILDAARVRSPMRRPPSRITSSTKRVMTRRASSWIFRDGSRPG